MNKIEYIPGLKIEVEEDGSDFIYYQENPLVHLYSESKYVTSWLKHTKIKSYFDSISGCSYDGLFVGDFSIPVARTICSRCDGKGYHANPVFNGSSFSDWEEYSGPDYLDELDEYFNGDKYDIACENNCHSGIGLKVDWHFFIKADKVIRSDSTHTIEDLNSIRDWMNDIVEQIYSYYEVLEIEASERRMGA
jgi:hypothetical protein